MFSAYDDHTLFQTDAENAAKDSGCLYRLGQVEGDAAACVTEQVCNWNRYAGLNESDCLNPTNRSEIFCAIRLDDASPFYWEVSSEICDASQSSICVIPSGAYIENVNPDLSCNDLGSCSGLCHSPSPQCVPLDPLFPSICGGVLTERDCLLNGGTYTPSDELPNSKWINQTSSDVSSKGWCVFPLLGTAAECGRSGRVFITCQSLGVSDCASAAPLGLECFVGNFRVCNQTECRAEGEGGDSGMVRGLGAVWRERELRRSVCECVRESDMLRGHACDSDRVRSSKKKTKSFPFVSFFCELTFSIPSCADPRIDESECLLRQANGWKFYRHSSNESECLSYGYGCVTNSTFETSLLSSSFTDPNMISNNYADVILRCPNDVRPLVEWIDGVWIGGQNAQVGWQRREMFAANQWNDTLDFVSLQSFVTATVDLEQLSAQQNLVWEESEEEDNVHDGIERYF